MQREETHAWGERCERIMICPKRAGKLWGDRGDCGWRMDVKPRRVPLESSPSDACRIDGTFSQQNESVADGERGG